MADSITDNRTLLIANEAADADLDDLTGAADTGGDNTEIFIEGSASRSFKVSQGVDGRLYDAGSAQDWSNNHFYMWIKCTSLTDTLANGGVRIRFCGATVTDWFEKYVYGGNIGSIQGWEMVCIDIEKARSDAVGGIDGGTNGTTPATTAIRYVGVVFDVPGMVSGNTDNCFIDAMWRLPNNTAGILVQGQDQSGGAHDWNWQDIVDAGDVTDTSKAWGTVFQKDGIITLNTPIQFGANDTTTHGFADTNIVVAWQDNLVADTFYGMTILGNSGGTTDFDIGLKTGTGDDATGAQGMVVTAESSGVRWYFDGNDANADNVNLYGCTFLHGGAFSLDSAAVETISCLFNDCDSAIVSNSVFLRNSIINANTADGVAFLTTDDLADVDICTFEFSDGHGIELTGAAATYTLNDVQFTGYGADDTNDAALYVSAASGNFTINVDHATTVRDGGATVDIVLNPVTTKFTVENDEGTAIANARVVAETADDGGGSGYPFEDSVSITQSGGTATVTHTAHGLATNDYIVIRGAQPDGYNKVAQITVTGANAYTYSVDSGLSSPATGSPIASYAAVAGLTNGSGVISASKSWPASQGLKGWARKKNASSPFYKDADINIADASSGTDITLTLQDDE